MKTILMTGGAQGIGRASSEYFLQKGWSVVIADTDQEAAQEISGGFFVLTDVSDEASVQQLIKQTLERYGRIDALVNNAGIGITKPLTELSLAEWNKVIGVNLTGTFLCAKYAAQHLAKHQGNIVNVASTRALMSEPNTEAYTASKGGIVSLTHALAISLGPKVRVNCISPGWIETRDWQKQSQRQNVHHSETDKTQHPVGHVGSPQYIATLIEYLVAEQSAFITGQNFIVDGGMTKKMIYS
jgi:NAD(P)-dependent dehydrogenase (short-subunit alcohol dehydrogenase family)